MKTVIKSMSLFVIAVLTSLSIPTIASELYIGTSSVDITPKLPFALMGQFNLRIAKTAETPLTANVVALESREGERSLDMAIMVSCDLIGIPSDLLSMVRDGVQKQLTGVDVMKISLNATHTHTGPVLVNTLQRSFRYNIPTEGVTQPEECLTFISQRIADAIVKAWNNRRPGSVTWGLSHAIVGYNRRAAYANGSAQMYGKTDTPDFRNLEGFEDHDVNILFFWDQKGQLIAATIDLACTAQEVENDYTANADYWHPVRVALQKRFGSQLCVLGWTAAAGDYSPHLMYRKAADDRMRELRHLSRVDEIARRIVNATVEAYEAVKDDRHTDVKIIHRVEILTLPMRLVTEAEYKESVAKRDEAAAQIAADPKAADEVNARMTWFGSTAERYEKQKTEPNPKLETEIHVLRIGDVAVCTNQFELFSDYGIRIEARSKALQTFVIQLAGTGTYLPTERAVKGGGYSAIVQSSIVGPEGGQMLVDRTVELINGLWPETK